MKKKPQFKTIDELFSALLKKDPDALSDILLSPMRKSMDNYEDTLKKMITVELIEE